MEHHTAKHQAESCSRCGGDFTCKPLNISECDCMKIRMSPEELDFVSTNHSICICNKCLKELKYEYYLNHHHNKTA